MIDKSLKQHYEMQGKVKNYLGKQKMVKAPVKWKSGPDHPNTELAYITKAEKDALIKMNMYGSMNGKANKGPSGIISLNGWGDSDRGYDGGNDTDTGGSDDDYNYTPAPAPAPSVSFHEDDFITPEPAPSVSFHEDDFINTTPTKTFADDGTSLYTTPPNVSFHEDDFITKPSGIETIDDRPSGTWTYAGPKPTFTPSSDSIYSTPTINPDADDENKSLSYIQSKPKTGFWNSGLGKILKFAGSSLIPGLLPAQLAKMYQTYKTGKGIYNVAKKFAPNTTGKVRDIALAGFNNIPQGSGGKGPPTVFNDSDNNEGNALVANNVIAKSVQEYSPAQVKSLQNNINLLSSVMKNGQYQGKQLNKSQITQIASKRSELQNQYDMIKGSLV